LTPPPRPHPDPLEPAPGASRPSPRHRTLIGAVLVALILPLALGARWRWAATAEGRQLRPRPDALEYAAAAQAIAQGGRYYLQVGPYRVRPRYPPGWPLVLAGAVRLGVAGDELWRVAGLFGAGLACLLALLAAAAVLRLAHRPSHTPSGGLEDGQATGASPPGGTAAGRAAGRRTAAAALAAGLLAGLAWALAPVAVAVGRAAVSDEPAALAAVLALVGTAGGMLKRRPGAGWRLPAAIGGASFGLLAALRPASALLVAPAALLLAAHGWRARGGRETLRRAALWAGGAAVAPLLTMALLWRSDLSPWQWNAYDLWVPRWYADLHATFNLRYALAGNHDFARGPGGRPIPNLRFYAEALLGVPGLTADSYVGRWWPALGWLAGAALAWRYRHRPKVAAGAWAAAAMAAAYFLFHSLYFYPTARFLLAPLALPPLALAVACGLGLALPGPRARLAAGLAAAALAAAVVCAFLAFRAERGPALPDRDPRAAVAAWLRLPDSARAAAVMPFDPLEAQALGLLPPELTARIAAWGQLPPTVEVRRLRALGLIPPR
jgi:hypothetical protein